MNGIVVLILSLLLLSCSCIAVFLIVRTLVMLHRDKESIDVMNVKLADMTQRITTDETDSGNLYNTLKSTIDTTRSESAIMASNIGTNVTTQTLSIGSSGSLLSLGMMPASNASRGDGASWLYLNNSSNTQFANFGVGSLLADNGIAISKGSCINFGNGASMCDDGSTDPNMQLRGNLLFGTTVTGGVTSSNINGTRMFTQFSPTQTTGDVRLGFTSALGTTSDALVINQTSNKNSIQVLGSLHVCDESGSNCTQLNSGLTGTSYLMKITGNTLVSLQAKPDFLNVMTLACFISNQSDTGALPPNTIIQIDTSITLPQMSGLITRLKTLDNFNCSNVSMIPSYQNSIGRNPYQGTTILPPFNLSLCG